MPPARGRPSARRTRSTGLMLAAGLLMARLPPSLVAQDTFGKHAVPWNRARTLPVMNCRLEPPYPPEARAARVEGLVIVEAVVEASGSVSEVRVVQPLDAALDEAALSAARACHGTPVLDRDSHPIAAVTRIPFVFRLRRPGLLEGDPDSQSVTDKLFAGDAYAAKSPGVVLPEVIHQVFGQYTPEAMKNGIQGDIMFDVVVGADGHVRSVRRLIPATGLGGGLDAQAEAALMKWTFKPATLKGHPVAVVVQIQMTFRMH